MPRVGHTAVAPTECKENKHWHSVQHALQPGAGHSCPTTACAGHLCGTVSTLCCDSLGFAQGEGQRIVSAKPLEAATSSHHLWSVYPRAASGSARAAWAMPFHQEGMDLPQALHQCTLLREVQWSEEGAERMRNLPCLPKCRREGSDQGGCHTTSKPCAWWAAGSQLPVPAAWPRTALLAVISQGSHSADACWLSSLFTAGITKAAQQFLCCAWPYTNLQEANSRDAAPCYTTE